MADIHANGKMSASITVGTYSGMNRSELDELLSTKADVEHAHDEYLTQHQDISHLATKEEIPSIEGLASEEYVNNAIDAIPEVDLSNCATKEELNEVKSSVSNGKSLLASAITDKGVNTLATDSFETMANNIENIQAVEYENPDFFEIRTKGNTDYSYLFYNYTGISLDLSSWDTSNVTNMMYMFYGCSSLTSLDLSNWDTSNVPSMIYMFADCSSLTSLDLSSFNTNKVTKMGQLFYRCSSLTSLDLSNWDTSNVTSFTESIYGMIYYCPKLVNIEGELDFSNAKNGIQYNKTYKFLYYCNSLKKIKIKNIYKNVTFTSSTDGEKFSFFLGDTKIEDQYLISLITELPDLINDKGLTNTSKFQLELPPTNTLTQEQVQPAINKGWQVSNTTY